MPGTSTADAGNTAQHRKLRGAYFTPEALTRFVTDWAIRGKDDVVLEPSAGEAAFLVDAVRRLREHGATEPVVHGVEVHPQSALNAHDRVVACGGKPDIITQDFFQVEPAAGYTAVVGNPPYIRYQDFSGESRTLSRAAALRAGVSLTALASSWAAFTVHSALFLKPGGRMGLVLPAELLSVNYAAAVRSFLFERFRSVELVLFSEQVFPDAEADVVLLLADGFEEGPAGHATIYETQNAGSLHALNEPLTWTPEDPSGKWTALLLAPEADQALRGLLASERFTALQSWGETTLGMVTGNNKFFTLSPARVGELGLPRRDLIRLSPPGSSHLRGLELDSSDMKTLGAEGRATWLFRPSDRPSAAALAYIQAGQVVGVDEAYKCRVRTPWYRVPLLPPADILLTYMNADTPRLTTNSAAAHHLNSVHGVYLKDEARDIGRELLPIASLNSVTLLSAEMVGRSYGGGVLKLEPREADQWAVPSLGHVREYADALREIRPTVASLLRHGDLMAAVKHVDEALLLNSGAVSEPKLNQIRQAHRASVDRRLARGRSGRR